MHDRMNEDIPMVPRRIMRWRALFRIDNHETARVPVCMHEMIYPCMLDGSLHGCTSSYSYVCSVSSFLVHVIVRCSTYFIPAHKYTHVSEVLADRGHEQMLKCMQVYSYDIILIYMLHHRYL